MGCCRPPDPPLTLGEEALPDPPGLEGCQKPRGALGGRQPPNPGRAWVGGSHPPGQRGGQKGGPKTKMQKGCLTDSK
jgi:hypothetical protein